MKDMNKVFLVGRLGTNPVQRETKNGIPVVNFSLATNRKTKAEGDSEGTATGEEVQWHRVVSWGKTAEACSRYLGKGDKVLVEGYLRTRKYEGQDGNSRYSFEVNAENVVFLSGNRRKTEVSADAGVEAAGEAGVPVETPAAEAAPVQEMAMVAQA